MFRLFLGVLIFSQLHNSAQTIKSIEHNSVSRVYMEFIPSSYTGLQPVPLVIALHGLGDTITNFNVTGFQTLGEIGNFITVYPQGMSGFVGTAWNAGVQYYGIQINSQYDDVSFISALIDTLSDEYNIDPTRIYVTGFSMGGFMANRIACELSDRIAAIASVAGTRGNMITNCQPWRSVPFCHFHGTADGTVYYTGNNFGMDTPDLVTWWATWNQCQTPPDSTLLPDNVPGDGIVITHFEYPNGIQNSNVEFYRADSADHVWLYQPMNDTTYTILIWEFFKKHQLTTLDISQNEEQITFSIYPTVASDFITITSPSHIKVSHIRMYSSNGQVSECPVQVNGKADISMLPQGIYICEIFSDNNISYRTKLIISR